jgi:hypothetical protein
MSGKSAFRCCGRDLVEFFNNTVWAFFVQVDYFRVACDSGIRSSAIVINKTAWTSAFMPVRICNKQLAA